MRGAAVALGAGLVHGALLALSFPPFGLWGLAFAAIAPLALLARRTARPWRDALLVWAGALPAWGWLHWWVVGVSALGFFPLVMYLALYPAAFVVCAAALRRILAPGWWWGACGVVWAGLETLRGEVVWGGYAWWLIGHPTVDAPLWSMSGRTVGQYGVSLLTAAACCGALGAIVERGRGRAAGGAAALASAGIALGLGALGLAAAGGAPGREVRIGVVQTAVPQDARGSWTFERRTEDFRAMARLSVELAESGEPAVIAWPETMFPGLALNAEAVEVERAARLVYPGGVASTQFADELLALQSALGTPLLIGASAMEGLEIEVDEDGSVRVEAEGRHNSAFVVREGRVTGRYDKVHLTPFGEVMPLISRWEWLESRLLAIAATGMPFDLESGDGAAPVAVMEGSLWLGTPICFEATSARVCREMVFGGGGRRAGALVNLTNDGWFGGSSAGREGHLLTARWRCVELGTPMVRAANTGISASIDATGRVIERLGAWEEAWGSFGVRYAEGEGRTGAAMLGEGAGWSSLAATGAGLVWSGVRRRADRRKERTEAGGGRSVEGASGKERS